MIDLLPDMPADTIGLRVSGAITRYDFREIEPVIREAAERGDLRVVEVIGPEYEGIRAGAVVEDLKFGVEFFVRHRSALKRIAVVTDTDWIARAVPALTWLIPGEARVFDLAELEQAKAWAAREEGSQSGGPLASESPSEVRATANMTASRAAQRRSVVVAYDGSEPSKVAVRRTAELFPTVGPWSRLYGSRT